MYIGQEIKQANKTSRGKGAVGKNAIVPRYVIDTFLPGYKSILDFGAGKEALHTKMLSKEGYSVDAYEFGDNVNENHNPDALNNEYDIVLLSNVLNVQQSSKMLKQTLEDVKKVMHATTLVVANYPQSPRYLKMGIKDLIKTIEDYGFMAKYDSKPKIIRILLDLEELWKYKREEKSEKTSR